jgi:hypothetical protein
MKGSPVSGAPEAKTDNIPQIEVTPEMIKAGLRAYYRHDSRFNPDEDAVVAIYRAMQAATAECDSKMTLVPAR